MPTTFSSKKTLNKNGHSVHIIRAIAAVSGLPLERKQQTWLRKELKAEGGLVTIHDLGVQTHVILLPKRAKTPAHKLLEGLRKQGHGICAALNKARASSVQILADDAAHGMAMAEGIALSNYQFLKYRKDKKEKANSLKRIQFAGAGPSAAERQRLQAVTDAVYETRDLVNEPLSYLTAPQLGKEVKRMAKQYGYAAEVMGKKKIEALKMGGLLSVNLGSVDEPSFSILEWKPKDAVNERPIVLVGKGVVYDTGGMSLKPTPNSMDMMKCDMAGAAMMIGTMAAVSKAELPLHIIALIPATDNRPGGNAYVPGDVVTMYDGTTVEVLNTDAEGRMLLADALAYAKKYDPELVIESATLTGAAVRAIGTYASCVMGTADERDFKALEESGYHTYERVARMPFWDEYGEEMKSDIADLKNIGGAAAGQISAGKFLEHFTDYPFIHIDIAGPSYLTAPDSYRGKWGTGYGVRLLFDMLAKRADK